MKTIWTNGCYDILHIGHIRLFKYAKSIGDQLIVGIDSDQRVRELKGEGRPVNCQEHRKEMLLSLKYIDKVVIFNTEEELANHVKHCNANSIVVGSDYKNKRVIGSEYAQVEFFTKIDDVSSTRTIELIRTRAS